jgi:predicted lipoprotein
MMNTLRRLQKNAVRYAICGILKALILNACEDSTVGPTDIGEGAAPVLKDAAEGVILATYADLDDKAALLVQAVDALNSSTTDANLDAARQAWRDARRPWEQSEAFLFGPVDTKGIDPGIDSWPVNRVDLDGVLAGSATLTKEYIDGLEGTLKGFHTMEYLLFGAGSGKTAADLTAREREYLTALVRSFKGSTAQLRNEWEASGGNFVAQLANAGGQGSSYLSRKDGIQELLSGMAGIADEVANGKINDPYTQKDRTLEESQFSNNSIADFQDNIRSIRNLYLGTYGSFTGKGITTLVAAKNAVLDARVRQEIDAAITAIGEMTPSFGEAITSNTAKVEAAQTAVRTLQHTLESEVSPLVLEL